MSWGMPRMPRKKATGQYSERYSALALFSAAFRWEEFLPCWENTHDLALCLLFGGCGEGPIQ